MSQFNRNSLLKQCREKETFFTKRRIISVPDLSTLALMGYPFAVLEGYLWPRPRRGGRLRFHADQSEGNENRVIHERAPIQCRKGNYFLTAFCLYLLQRLPDPHAGKS